MPPLLASFSDAELDTIMRLAAPLEQSQRDEFLQQVAAELKALPRAARGDGSVHRVGAQIQRRFVSPPSAHDGRFHSKYR